MYLNNVEINENRRWHFLKIKLGNIILSLTSIEKKLFNAWIKNKEMESLNIVKNILEKIANKL